MLSKYLCLIVLISLCACNNSSQNNRFTQEQINSLQLKNTRVIIPKINSLTEINLTPFLNKKTFDFGKLVEEVNFISLETKNESLIGGIYKILTTEEFIYIMDDFRGRSIIIFDKNGKFVRRFTHGQGPGELSRVYDMDYDFKNEELVVYQHSFFLFFDKQGNYIRQERLPIDFDNFVTTGNGYIFKTVPIQGNNHLGEKEKYRFLFANKKFNINSVAVYQSKEPKALSAYTYLYKNEGLLSLTGQLTDTIYKYNEKSNELAIEFILNYKKKLPREYIYGENYEVFEKATYNNDYYFNIGNYLETFSQNIFFLENNYIKYQTVIYRDKKTGNMTGGTNANYDVNELPPIAFPKAVYKDYFISVYVPSVEGYSLLKNSKMISEEDKEKIKLSKEEDNPVLVYFKLKEF